MKKVFKYYVVDSLTESVVGSFFALNGDVAIKVIAESYNNNDKLKQIAESLKLVYYPNCYTELETFDEVMDVCIDVKWTPIEMPSNG